MPDFTDSEWVPYAFFLFFGAIAVYVRAQERFSEPDYIKRFLKHSEELSIDHYYLRYMPRFSAVSSRFQSASRCYIYLCIGVYLVIATTPGILEGIYIIAPSLDQIKFDRPFAYPIGAMMLLLALNDFPGLQKITKAFRERLYKWARIPVGSRETAKEMRAANFNFDRYKALSEFNSNELEFRFVDDADCKMGKETLEYQWVAASCLLYNLRMAKDKFDNPATENLSYDDAIFEEYDAEYQSIIRIHRSIAASVLEYKAARRESNGNRPLGETYKDTEITVNALWNKITTFMACAVRPTVKTESDVTESLKACGFDLHVPPFRPFDIHIIAAAMFVFVAIMIIVIFFTSEPWFETMVAPIGELKKLHPIDYSIIPTEPHIAIIWGISTGVIHFSSALTAMYLRRRAIKNNSWKYNHLARPYWAYAKLAIIGGAIGYGLVCIISILMVLMPQDCSQLTAFKHDCLPDGFDLWRYMLRLAAVSLVWFLLPALSALFAVFHSDTLDYQTDPKYVYGLPLLQAVVMGLIALGMAFLFMKFRPMIYPNAEYGASIDIRDIDRAFAGYAALLVAYIGGYMGWFLSFRRRCNLRKQMIGKWNVTFRDSVSFPISDEFSRDVSIVIFQHSHQPHNVYLEKKPKAESDLAILEGSWCMKKDCIEIAFSDIGLPKIDFLARDYAMNDLSVYLSGHMGLRGNPIGTAKRI